MTDNNTPEATATPLLPRDEAANPVAEAVGNKRKKHLDTKALEEEKSSHGPRSPSGLAVENQALREENKRLRDQLTKEGKGSSSADQTVLVLVTQEDAGLVGRHVPLSEIPKDILIDVNDPACDREKHWKLLLEAGCGKEQPDGEIKTFLDRQPKIKYPYGYHSNAQCLVLPGWE